MEVIGISESKNLRVQVILAISFGGLYAFSLFLMSYSYQEYLYAGLVLSIEILIGARLMATIFRYFQPKKTFSFVPITILILQTSLITSLFYFVHCQLPVTWQPQLFLPNFKLHFLFLFLIFWILFYEWWFSKNDVRNASDTQRLLLLQENLKNAEIKNVQQNIQPHFLFNSLNSISSLTITEPMEAQKMVVKLSEFLRHSVVKNQKMFVSLQEELEQINRYLAIEQIRFSHRLTFELVHDDTNNEIQIPAMLLQPLIENAIKYGLYGQTGKALIQMSCVVEGNYLVVRISNPVDESHAVNRGTGFGLKSIRRKMYLLYAENNVLNTELKDQIFRTELKIPLRYESNID